MEKIKIATFINNTESPVIYWPVVPRIGESVEADDNEEYKIVDVVHMFRRKNDVIRIVLETKK